MVRKLFVYVKLFCFISVAVFTLYSIFNNFHNSDDGDKNPQVAKRILKYKDYFEFFKADNIKFEKNSNYLSQFHFNEEEKPILFLEAFPFSVEPKLSNWTVHWSAAPTYIAGNSWIGAYPFAQRTTNWNLQSYFEVNKTQDGMKELQTPKEAGVYEIRYIQDNNLHAIASTGPIIINPADVFLTLSKTETSIGESIFAAWDIQKDSLLKFQLGREGVTTTGAFLCLNIVGSYDYEDCYWKKEIKSSTGVEKIKLPTFAGYFVLRILFKYQSWKFLPEIESIAVSSLVKVSDPDFKFEYKSLKSVVASSAEVKWKVKKSKENDWIGFYSLETNEVFTRSASPIQSIKVKGANKGIFEAYIPYNNPAGAYIFIYFSNHVPVAVSELINIQQPQLRCPNEQKTQSNIKHVVIICTENHSFDAYFGSYCEGEENSNSSCSEGAKCCEKPPKTVQGFAPVVLNDTQNIKWDPNHNQDCERCEINGGRMDGFVTGCFCSDQQNFAVADNETVAILHNYAKEFALADRYFQPTAGASSQNDMYFTRADYVFRDNKKIPIGSVGSNCWYLVHGIPDEVAMLYDPTITSLLSKCGFVLRSYAEGYYNASLSFENNKCYPYGFDASDIPYNYYSGISDHPKYITDYDNFKEDMINGTLPDVSFIKPLGYKTAHPGDGNITDETNFIKEVVDQVLNSTYADDTLIIWVPDESGGYYDHISPPPTNEVDKIPYGPRTPLLVIGKFAKKNYISHVTMEHSSIVKFIEWNWLSGESGQLNTRDRNVNSIGDLIDPVQAGIKVPN